MNRDLREDQEYILDEITELARRERPDAVVIAGDIYDKAVPSAEAVEVFDHFLVGLTEACLLYTSNRLWYADVRRIVLFHPDNGCILRTAETVRRRYYRSG